MICPAGASSELQLPQHHAETFASIALMLLAGCMLPMCLLKLSSVFARLDYFFHLL